MSKSEDKVIGELEFLRHIVRETARMSYPGRFGGKLRGGAKKAIQSHFEKVYPDELQAQIENYDAWHKDLVDQLSQVIEEGNYRQDENDTSFALSVKLVNTFMHQLMKYDRFRYFYKKIHLPLDKSVFVSIYRIIPKHDRTELHSLRELVRPHRKRSYEFGENEYKEIQEKLWIMIKYFNEVVLPKNCQICSRIDLNCLLW